MNSIDLFTATPNQRVRIEGDLVCLNDIWVLGGSPENQDPRQWYKYFGKQLVDTLSKNLHVGTAHIYNSSRARLDRGGGTWAHKLLALEYAGYLSPDLRLRINDTYLRVKSGDYSVIEETLNNQSIADQKRTVVRIQGKVARNDFTQTLQDHGVVAGGFAQCTDAIYRPLLGGSAKAVRESRNLPVKANLREHMSMKELAAITLAEILAESDINAENPHGNTPCAKVCLATAKRVASIL